jgi:ABC-type polysaccharide/polyol phosphate transport system ATPase subunit
MAARIGIAEVRRLGNGIKSASLLSRDQTFSDRLFSSLRWESPSIAIAMAIIEVHHVTKQFQLGQMRSLRQNALDAFARLRRRSIPERKPFKALDDMSFKVEAGEVVGIIGPNGAGKSTLLKLLAGISKPSDGTIAVRGSVAPLIEVGAGLVPDLTGRENIYLNGCILGMNRSEVKAKYNDIVTFAELADFIDTPIKRYSSGMQVRLGFSIATSVDADILIVDEVLAVGDLAFQRKCFDRMEEMIRRMGKTVLLVSHNIRQVERLCNRVVLIDHGRIVDDGDPNTVCNLFYERSDEKIREQADRRQHRRGYLSSGDVELVNVNLLDDTGNPTSKVIYGSNVVVSVVYRLHSALRQPIFGVGIHTTDSLYLTTHNSIEEAGHPKALSNGLCRVDFAIKGLPFLPGLYSLRLGVHAGGLSSPLFYAENVLQFQVEDRFMTRAEASHSGFVALNGSWSIRSEAAPSLEEEHACSSDSSKAG